MHERNEGLRLFCVFRVHVILTTDIQDLTDFHHERKRANQIHQIHPFLFSFYEHEMHERNESFRLFCVFRVHVILTTDIQNLTDFHHEHKQAYPFNLCNLCSKEKGKRKRMYLFLFLC